MSLFWQYIHVTKSSMQFFTKREEQLNYKLPIKSIYVRGNSDYIQYCKFFSILRQFFRKCVNARTWYILETFKVPARYSFDVFFLE